MNLCIAFNNQHHSIAIFLKVLQILHVANLNFGNLLHCILSYFWLGLLFSAGKYYFCQLSWIVRLSDVSLCYISSQHLTSQNNKMSRNISYAAARKENTHFKI